MKTYDEIKQAMQADPELYQAQLAVEQAQSQEAKINAFTKLREVADRVEHECSR